MMGKSTKGGECLNRIMHARLEVRSFARAIFVKFATFHDISACLLGPIKGGSDVSRWTMGERNHLEFVKQSIHQSINFCNSTKCSFNYVENVEMGDVIDEVVFDGILQSLAL